MPSKRNKMVRGEIMLSEQIKYQTGVAIAEEGCRLMSVFLGTVRDGEEPDPIGRLVSLGWTRAVVYEFSGQYGDGEQRWVHRLNFTANSPKEAANMACDLAETLLDEEREKVDTVEMLAVTVRTMRLGPIEDGKPHNGRGPVFVGWTREQEPWDDLRRKIEEQS